ncbi:MAG TPA: carboxypeptidase-like regulatory domain-containing protein, partial [Terriglobales bacterium]|nr:carboxypeptidase-like regulatory domain-containing protein [Terriglobales bacterium]
MKSNSKFLSFASLILFLLPVFALLAGSPALAQTSLGTISGTVRDPSGAVIAGASVTLTNEATQVSRTVITNEQGAYRADAVQPGPYTVKVTASGFDRKQIEHLAVQPSIITSQDINLEVGKLTSEVQVEAANPASLDTDT